MLLGTIERFYVNGWLRGAVQRPLELWALNCLHPFPLHAQLLDVGCGDGRALVALAKRCKPLGLAGIDADPKQIAAASHNLKHAGLSAHLQTSSAETLPLPAQTYDVVTGFGVLHHVPAWALAVREIARVLRHGGVYYGLEFYRPLLAMPVFRQLFPHPTNRFTHAELIVSLQQQGLTVLRDINLLGLAGLVVARRVAGDSYD
jgi:ubiquinone/menaquinone biosynthesis C-methylase UbiE